MIKKVLEGVILTAWAVWMCLVPFLALGILITACISFLPVAVGVGFIALIHVPIFWGLIWGSEETKQAIGNHHPPGHE